MTNVIISAYCHCIICCSAGNKITANGLKPIEGITVAASRSIPLNTPIYLTINNVFTNRFFIIQDRLAKRYDNRIDIYFVSHRQAKKFGIQKGSYEKK